jgi:hypothetical protein
MRKSTMKAIVRQCALYMHKHGHTRTWVPKTTDIIIPCKPIMIDVLGDRVWAHELVLDLRLECSVRTRRFAQALRALLKARPTHDGNFVNRMAMVAVTTCIDSHQALLATTTANDILFYDPMGYVDIDLDDVAARAGLVNGRVIECGDPCSPSLQGLFKSDCCVLLCISIADSILDCKDIGETARLLQTLHEPRNIRKKFAPEIVNHARI